MLLYIKDVINLLKTFDQNAVLFVSCDSEGNSISPLGNCYTTSTLNFDKKYYNLDIRELEQLPDQTKTITLFPEI